MFDKKPIELSWLVPLTFYVPHDVLPNSNFLTYVTTFQITSKE